MTHPFTRIVFRVGDSDAQAFAKGFASFEARDLQNLETGQAIARVERSDFDFNLAVQWPKEPDAGQAAATRKQVVTSSREKYATPRSEVEAAMLQAARGEEPEKSKAKTRPAPILEPPASEANPAPTVAELPKVTGSEKIDVSPASIEPSQPAVPAPSESVRQADKASDSRDLGRGGDLHKTLQMRLQTEAQKLGFRAEIESQLKKGSNQAADLVLQRDDLTIAVEIPVEGSLSYEFGNVKKCLAAGFARVAVVSLRPKFLEQLAGAVSAALGQDEAAKVSYSTPEEFLSELRKLAANTPAKPKPPPKPNTEIIGNYEVESEFPTLTREEQKQREAAAIRLIAETMRQANKK